LKQDSTLVAQDEHVEQGQVIALSGYSGGAGEIPHLHFQVLDAWPPDWPPTLDTQEPVNFRNALGPLDRRGGLIQDVYYRALRD
jgi:murein DD-endopeptidase MepM/ murein hydrolase activator NlpD